MSNKYFKIEPGHIITDDMIKEMVSSIVDEMSKLKSDGFNGELLKKWREEYSLKLAEENNLDILEVPGIDAFIGGMIRSIEESMLMPYKPFVMLLGVVQKVLKNPVKRIPQIPKDILCIVQGLKQFLKDLPEGSAIQLAYDECLRDYVDKANIPILSAKYIIEILLGKRTFKEIICEIRNIWYNKEKTFEYRFEKLQEYFLLPTSFIALANLKNVSSVKLKVDDSLIDKMKEYGKDIKTRDEDGKLSIDKDLVKKELKNQNEGETILDNYIGLLFGENPITKLKETIADKDIKEYLAGKQKAFEGKVDEGYKKVKEKLDPAKERLKEDLDAANEAIADAIKKLEASPAFTFISIMQMTMIPLKMLIGTIEELVCFLMSIVKSPVKLVKEIVKILKNPLEWVFCFISKATVKSFASLAAALFMADPRVIEYIEKLITGVVEYFMQLKVPTPDGMIAKLSSVVNDLKAEVSKASAKIGKAADKTMAYLEQAINYFSSISTLLLIFYFIIKAVIEVVMCLKNLISWLFNGGKKSNGCKMEKAESGIDCDEEYDCDKLNAVIESFMLMYDVQGLDLYSSSSTISEGTTSGLKSGDVFEEGKEEKIANPAENIFRQIFIKFGQVDETDEVKAPTAEDIAIAGNKFNMYFYKNEGDEQILVREKEREYFYKYFTEYDQMGKGAQKKKIIGKDIEQLDGATKKEALICEGEIKSCTSYSDTKKKKKDNWFLIEFKEPCVITKRYINSNNVKIGIEITE